MNGLDRFGPLLEAWSGEHVVVRYDAPTGAWIFIAIHSSRRGVPTGGTRYRVYARPDDGLEDALKLAAAMTRKWAVVEMPRGGGKAVIAAPPDLERAARDGLLLRYGEIVDSMRGSFYTGPDLGTTSVDMDLLRRRTGYVSGHSKALGGAGDSAPFTALGIFFGMRACAEHAFGADKLAGLSVVVQGVGSVGVQLIELLKRASAIVVATDADREKLAQVEATGVEIVEPDAVYDQECDIFAPCAIGGVLDAATIARLRCRVVAGAANNPLAGPDDAKRLADRGILYAPDFVINAGGAIALVGMEHMSLSRMQVEDRLRGIGATLRSIFARAKAESITPEEAANRLAAENLAKPLEGREG
ncbi:MAG: phenylalanine dehydrogenase [Planctomycetes bacterium]|nr:phenylalanine dehydrogenase [Planctomycetota bacterium]MBI3846677.1 phenylalanine dehydrogenase [Planctomycetota bacterium]